jgi:hypothetical protein
MLGFLLAIPIREILLQFVHSFAALDELHYRRDRAGYWRLL